MPLSSLIILNEADTVAGQQLREQIAAEAHIIRLSGVSFMAVLSGLATHIAHTYNGAKAFFEDTADNLLPAEGVAIVSLTPAPSGGHTAVVTQMTVISRL